MTSSFVLRVVAVLGVGCLGLATRATAADLGAEWPVDSDDVEVLRDFRMAELGIEPVLDDDGLSYHYALPSGLETPALRVRGAMEYVYDGQQVFAAGAERSDSAGRITFTHPSFVLTDVSVDAEAYLGVGETVTVDEYGRRWLLSGYDDGALWDQIDAYDQSVDRTYGLEAGQQERTGIEADRQAGEIESVDLDTDTWVAYDCDGDTTSVETLDHTAGGTTAGLTVSPYNVRQPKVVFIIGVGTVSGTTWNASGVLVDDDTVLTAAHVVIDGDTGTYTDQVNMRVCTYGNLQPQTSAECRTVSGLTTPGGTFDGTVADDYAVIQLTSAFSPAPGWMAMSTAGDATIESATHYHEGFPTYRPACVVNTTSDHDGWTVVGPQYLGYNYAVGAFEYFRYFGARQFTSYGPAKEALAAMVRFKVSSANGMSGSPFYYCPAGCAETSGTPFITAVTTGHKYTSTTNSWSLGPKASSFRDWVIAHL